MLFPFVRLEFTSSLGPAPGHYPVVPLEPRAGADDTLVIAVVGAPPPRERLRRRARVATDPGAVRELAVLRVTWVRTSAPVADAVAGRRLLGDLRPEPEREELIEHALATLNVAIRAYGAAALDPFATEVSRQDPREVHLGVATGEQIRDGRWTEALSCPPPARGNADAQERVRLDVAVAEALAGTRVTLDGEAHALRALLDAELGRPRSAARELALAAELVAEQREQLDEAAAPESLDRHLERAWGASTGGGDDLAEAARGLLQGLAHVHETAWAERQSNGS